MLFHFYSNYIRGMTSLSECEIRMYYDYMGERQISAFSEDIQLSGNLFILYYVLLFGSYCVVILSVLTIIVSNVSFPFDSLSRGNSIY